MRPRCNPLLPIVVVVVVVAILVVVLIVVVVVVIRAGHGLIVGSRARVEYCTCMWVDGWSGYIQILWTYRSREAAIRLPIQHVQPSTCADTINQIN